MAPTVWMLSKEDRVLTAYAEEASGPGWSNAPLWVIVQSRDGKLRTECLQIREQTGEMITLYSTSQAAHLAMLGAVERWRRGSAGE